MVKRTAYKNNDIVNFVDQNRAQRQQPYEANQRPVRRNHISPLHQDSVVSSGNGPEPVKLVGTAAFSFGTAQTAICSEATQFIRATTISAVSPFSTAPAGFGSAFPASAGWFMRVSHTPPPFPCHSRDWKIEEGGLFTPLKKFKRRCEAKY